jgi:hypothetical protein
MDTLTVYEGEEGLSSGYVEDIRMDDGDNVSFRINDGWVDADPVYYHFKSRIYTTDRGCGFIYRRVKKSFKIGLSVDNHHLVPVFGIFRVQDIDPLKPLVFDVKQSLKEEGPVSDRIYLRKDDVFYLGKVRGIRRGSTFLVDPAIHQEVSDALRGHECLIRM